jgi:hypothetical protein
LDLPVAIRGGVGKLDSRGGHIHHVEFLGQGFDHHADVVEVALEESFA